MSQISMMACERIEALRRFGYSEPEASFLCLAALHGGYFLRRQYAHFLGGKDGGNVTQLVQKGLADGHLRSSAWRQNTQLYRLCARPFYEALGQGENRNRRAREVLTIKNKLMGFDFVLAHRHVQYLATEQEKVDYFTRTLKLNLSELPAKLYRSRQSSAATARYFVDKYPIFLSPADQEGMPSAAAAVVSFCFVDEGMISLSRFESYLAQYRSLFGSLRGFHLVYVAASEVHFGTAQRLFENFIRSGSAASTVPSEGSPGQLLEYFEARRLYESGQLASFDRAKLVQLRQARREFSNEEHEALYARWKAGGPTSAIEVSGSETARPPLILGTFSTFLLEHDYELFGRFPG
jgi:hypothetical protein